MSSGRRPEACSSFYTPCPAKADTQMKLDVKGGARGTTPKDDSSRPFQNILWQFQQRTPTSAAPSRDSLATFGHTSIPPGSSVTGKA